ncbi:MAG: hypothetical protein ABSH51_22915 [Solirubrobacteraceae bacterium]|jgi:hypothetical protein
MAALEVAARSGAVSADGERAARRTLRAQIARLERELAEAFVTAFPMGALDLGAAGTTAPSAPRILGLGELELVRDELARRLGDARAAIAQRADEQARKRVALERMLLRPGEHRFARVSCAELGEPGCGVWQVRPRMGLIGMLMGWWQVKLSSGCPLPRGRGPALAPAAARQLNRGTRCARS